MWRLPAYGISLCLTRSVCLLFYMYFFPESRKVKCSWLQDLDLPRKSDIQTDSVLSANCLHLTVTLPFLLGSPKIVMIVGRLRICINRKSEIWSCSLCLPVGQYLGLLLLILGIVDFTGENMSLCMNSHWEETISSWAISPSRSCE